MISLSRFGFYLLPIAVFICGCAGGGGPSAPPLVTEPGNLILLQQNDQSHEAQTAGHIPLIYASIYIDPTDPDDIKFEITPLREAGMHLNILKFLEKSPCFDCFKIVGFSMPEPGVLGVDIQITHPLTSPNFTIFDVRGIMMFDASLEFPESGLTTSDPTLGNGALLNAEGYTSLYNITTLGSAPELQGYIKGKLSSVTPPNGTLNGYIRHWSDDPANTRNALFANASDTKKYLLQLSSGPFIIGYAVDANWDVPLVDPVLNPMTDFGPDANCPEPWKIEAYADSIGASGETILSIDIYDWQDPPVLSAVSVESPDLFSGFKDSVLIVNNVGFSQWEVTIPNETGAIAGEYPLLIIAEDVENDPVNKPWLDLTAYQMIMIEVAEFVDELPTALAKANMYSAGVGDIIDFDASGSHDNDEGGESIVLYEWDWNGDENFIEEQPVTNHSWDTPGIYQVQLRVTDNEGSWDLLDEPLEIEILDTTEEGWVRVWDEWNNEVVTDIDGNVYVTGMDEDVNSGSVLRKLNSTGDLIWSVIWPEGSSMSLGDGIAIDSSGYVYVTGAFSSDGDFDPGPGEDIHILNGGTDIYLVKYSQDGEFQWARTWGGELYSGNYWWEKGHGVAIDEFDDIYAVGLFRGVCDFDPGTGVDEHTSNGYEVGGFDAYITKFNSDGDHLWAHTWGDINFMEDTGEIAFGVATDSNSDIYVVGGFLGTVDFDPGVGVAEFTSYGLWGDVYLLKFNPAGDFEWVLTWEALGYSDFPGTAQMWGGSYVYVDPSDDVLVTGFFEGTKDLDPGPGVKLFEGDAGFLSKFDSSGNFLWADIWPCSGLIQMMCYSVATDSDGNIYMGGEIGESVDLDPGPDTDYRSPDGFRDGILVKLDPDGGYLWGNNWGSSTPSSDNVSESWGVATYGTTSVYVCGFFMGDVDFDPGPGIEIHSSNGWGSFLTKFLSDGSW